MYHSTILKDAGDGTTGAEGGRPLHAVLSDREFTAALEEHIPHLRAFARGMCHSRDRADDLVQETMLKAWAARRRFARGTRFKAWVFKILRNTYLTSLRRRKFEGIYVEGSENSMSTPASQLHQLELNELRRALTRLPEQQQETLLLVVTEGMSYAEAAEICGCMIGTIKSRVGRARAALERMLEEGV
jgi:RNA polymerase sigma-70 factor (ECF subfamily)